ECDLAVKPRDLVAAAGQPEQVNGVLAWGGEGQVSVAGQDVDRVVLPQQVLASQVAGRCGAGGIWRGRGLGLGGGGARAARLPRGRLRPPPPPPPPPARRTQRRAPRPPPPPPPPPGGGG